jgi:hypothetical protein
MSVLKYKTNRYNNDWYKKNILRSLRAHGRISQLLFIHVRMSVVV